MISQTRRESNTKSSPLCPQTVSGLCDENAIEKGHTHGEFSISWKPKPTEIPHFWGIAALEAPLLNSGIISNSDRSNVLSYGYVQEHSCGHNRPSGSG